MLFLVPSQQHQSTADYCVISLTAARWQRRNLVFWRLILLKPNVLHQNLGTKGTSLGYQLAPKWFLSTSIVLFELHTLSTSTPLKLHILLLWGVENPLCKNLNTHWHLLFQKLVSALITEKPKPRHILVPFGRTLGRFSSNFLPECAPCSFTYIPDFIQSIQVCRCYRPENPSAAPPWKKKFSLAYL